MHISALCTLLHYAHYCTMHISAQCTLVHNPLAWRVIGYKWGGGGQPNTISYLNSVQICQDVPTYFPCFTRHCMSPFWNIRHHIVVCRLHHWRVHWKNKKNAQLWLKDSRLFSSQWSQKRAALWSGMAADQKMLSSRPEMGGQYIIQKNRRTRPGQPTLDQRWRWGKEVWIIEDPDILS